jgi:DNA-binding LacI/PurR family transcriptional regulator
VKGVSAWQRLDTRTDDRQVTHIMLDAPISFIVARATAHAYPELIPELVGQLQAHDLTVMLTIIEREGDVDDMIQRVMRERVGGVIAAALPSAASIRMLQARGVPLLLYNCHAPFADSVSCDHAACGRLLAEMLLEGGHRRFGIIQGSDDSLVSAERAAGALEALSAPRVLSVVVAEGDYSYESGIAALDYLYERMRPKPSAIIAVNDAMAIGALDRARALQIRIPRDLSVVGIDGTGLARLPVYQLATVRQPLIQMARAAVDVLFDRIRNPGRPAEARLFAGELITGRTARFERPAWAAKPASDDPGDAGIGKMGRARADA